MTNRDIFEAVCEYNPASDRIRVGWVSRLYGERQFVELRQSWGGNGRENAEQLRIFIDRLVGRIILAAHEAVRDARDTIHALLPVWERDIYRCMEQLEYRDRYVSEMQRAMYNNYGAGVADPLMWFDEFGITRTPPEDPKAKEKARQLLMRNLDDEQLKSFKKDGSFRITAKDGKVYTISTARSFNVKAEDGTKYCGQLVDTPVEDQMLAQKLLLEHDPEKFFKNANVSAPSGALAQMAGLAGGARCGNTRRGHTGH